MDISPHLRPVLHCVQAFNPMFTIHGHSGAVKMQTEHDSDGYHTSVLLSVVVLPPQQSGAPRKGLSKFAAETCSKKPALGVFDPALKRNR